MINFGQILIKAMPYIIGFVIGYAWAKMMNRDY
jgi:hypothetical protein